MTFVVKIRGDLGAPILAEYACPRHGVFEELVDRPSPDFMPCPECNDVSPWTITAAPMGKVRTTEVERGKWQKPEHPGWLDTRELGEGMPLEEWREKRAKIRDEQRRKDIGEYLK
jgi:hypothetical protein